MRLGNFLFSELKFSHTHFLVYARLFIPTRMRLGKKSLFRPTLIHKRRVTHTIQKRNSDIVLFFTIILRCIASIFFHQTLWKMYYFTISRATTARVACIVRTPFLYNVSAHREIFSEILLNQPEIRLYLPFSD